MMNFRKNKKIAIVMAIVVLSLALATTSFAADNYKNLKAWFGEIKIFHNGSQVQLKDKPFIVDGTTYLPVRAVSEMLNKEITWDGKNYHIGINDKPDLAYNEMLNKFIVQEITVTQLQDKVKELEAKLKEKEEAKVSTLSDMEKQLNKDYGTSDRIDFDITLYGSTSKVEVRIYIDDRTSSDRWGSWKASDNKSYLQKITNDILKEFKNAKVSGFIQDDYPTKSIKTTFDVSTRGDVSVGSTSGGSSNYYYDDIEELLYQEYVRYNSDGIIDIKVTEKWNSVYISIEVDDRDWYGSYPTTSQERLLQNMASDIVYEFNYYYSDISGEIYDDYGYNLYDFDFNSSGTVSIR